MRGTLTDLYGYTKWANQLYIDCLNEHKVKDDETLKWMSHIYNAYEFWLARIQHYKPNYELWETHNLKDLKALNKSYLDQIQTLLADRSDADLFKQVSYKNSKGEAQQDSFKDILIHMANHSSHHRAQVAVRLRGMGIDVPPSDYIFYKRLDQ